MVKRQLNPKIIELLRKKTGKNESSIRPMLSVIRNKYNVTLNAAAQIYAKKHDFTVARYLKDKDRESLKNIKFEKVRIKSQKVHKKQRVIEIAKYETEDNILKAHLNEINKAYTHGCYTACFVLCRKVLENLIIYKILRKKYPENNREHRKKYFDFSRNRFLDFEKIIKNLRNSGNDFGSEKNLVERICQLAGGFKETANEMTHSLYHIATKKEIDENNLQHLLDLIKTLEDSI